MTHGSKLPFRIMPSSHTNTLVLNDRSVRIGTKSPAQSLHIQPSAPAVRLDDGGRQWDVAGDGAGLRIEDSTAGSTPFQVETGARADALVLNSDGFIGFGTSNPTESLHIKSDDESRVRFEHVNGEVWSAGANPASFVITRANSGGNEFEIRNNGDIVFRFAGTELACLNRHGNLTTAGTVNGTSDVNRKRDFVAVDAAGVLSQVASLPISSWSYKADEPGIRHLGPIAQDFYAAFGLGIDERHIAASDLAGVALAAIQELSQENAAKDTEIEALITRLATLEARVGGLLAD